MMVSEEDLCICFRHLRGGWDNLGVKCQWWAKLVEYEWKSEPEGNTWRATAEQIDMADRLLFHVMPALDEYERKVLWLRCGRGFLTSFRKCGKNIGISHELFRKQYQQVIVKVQKILDEISKKDLNF